jgi:hypothetical protein
MDVENDSEVPTESSPELAALAAESSPKSGADDLDSLLAEWDTQTARPAEETADNSLPTIEDALLRSRQAAVWQAEQTLRSEVHNYAQQRAQEKHEADYKSLIARVRGEADASYFDDDMIRAWIDARAARDGVLQNAWTGRDSNPRQFQAAAERLAKEFGKYAARTPDPNLTEDTAAVAALVRGVSSTKALPEPQADYSRMSNAEYRLTIKNKYGFDPGI